MLRLNGVLGLASLIVAAVSAPATARASTDRPLSLVLSVGAEHDSNVAVEQTDTVTRKGDTRAVLGAEARYAVKPSDRLTVTLGYDFDQTLHNEFSAFDMQTHTLSLGAAQRLGAATLGADYSYLHILLGGHPFLNMHQFSPSLSGFVSKAVYLRGSASYTRKTFTTASAFNANNYQAGIDGYRFLMHARGYVSLSGRYETERTTGPELAYSGFQLGATMQLPVRTARLRLGYTYRQRHYDNVTTAIGAKRRETRSVVRAAGDIPLLGGLTFKPEFRFIDRASNYPLADYTETVASGAFSYRF